MCACNLEQSKFNRADSKYTSQLLTCMTWSTSFMGVALKHFLCFHFIKREIASCVIRVIYVLNRPLRDVLLKVTKNDSRSAACKVRRTVANIWKRRTYVNSIAVLQSNDPFAYSWSCPFQAYQGVRLKTSYAAMCCYILSSSFSKSLGISYFSKRFGRGNGMVHWKLDFWCIAEKLQLCKNPLI